jgi:hypothetical protein
VPLKLRAFLDFAVPRLKARLQEIAAIDSRSVVTESPGQAGQSR